MTIKLQKLGVITHILFKDLCDCVDAQVMCQLRL